MKIKSKGFDYKIKLSTRELVVLQELLKGGLREVNFVSPECQFENETYKLLNDKIYDCQEFKSNGELLDCVTEVKTKLLEINPEVF